MEANKSFFQRVLQKESQISQHVVLLVNHIQKCRNSCIIELCDGAYSMKCSVSDKQDKFDCDKKIIEMINNQQMKPGDKFHFQGLYLMNKSLPESLDVPLKTEHYYLQNKHNSYLKINYNGLSRALCQETLGEQLSSPFFTKCLSTIMQSSKTIPCIDVFIVKKYQ